VLVGGWRGPVLRAWVFREASWSCRHVGQMQGDSSKCWMFQFLKKSGELAKGVMRWTSRGAGGVVGWRS
jgi:hypothetical protein